MSYCRWSSDGFKCDVYVYEDVSGGWTTHVAGGRRLGLDTLPQDPYDYEFMRANVASPEWLKVYKAYHDALDKLEIAPIGLPFDGKTFNDPSPGECATRLKELRAVGYYVPQYAIDSLEEEQREQEAIDRIPE